jgi:hypothetical protein
MLYPLRLSYSMRLAYLLWRRANKEGLAGDMVAYMQYPPPSDSEIERNTALARGKYFKRNLRSILAVIIEHGATPVVISEVVNAGLEKSEVASSRSVVQGVKTNNYWAREVAAAKGAPFIDLFPYVRNPALFMDGVHTTDQGEALKARVIYEEMMRILGWPFPAKARLITAPATASPQAIP